MPPLVALNRHPLAAVALLTWSAVAVRRHDGARWPTMHGDLMRAGYCPQFPRPPFRLSRRKQLWRELSGPCCEVSSVTTRVCRRVLSGPQTDGMRPAEDCWTTQIALLLIRLFFVDRVRGQNIVEDTADGFTANPVALTDMEVSECFGRSPIFKPDAGNPEVRRIAVKIEAQRHHFRLARYYGLAPEVDQALHRWRGGCGAARRKAPREGHN